MIKNKPVVFISYNKHDIDQARELALFLVAESITVWYDEWQISAGDSIFEQINEGMRSCSHFIIIWSKNSATANWAKNELGAIVMKSISKGVPKVIPVKLDDTDLPELIADKASIDYNNGSEDARNNIIYAVLGRNATHNYIKSIVKKYNEVIYDYKSDDYLPYKACPMCGGFHLKFSSFHDNKGDEIYYIVKCTECEWSTWTQ